MTHSLHCLPAAQSLHCLPAAMSKRFLRMKHFHSLYFFPRLFKIGPWPRRSPVGRCSGKSSSRSVPSLCAFPSGICVCRMGRDCSLRGGRRGVNPFRDICADPPVSPGTSYKANSQAKMKCKFNTISFKKMSAVNFLKIQ